MNKRQLKKDNEKLKIRILNNIHAKMGLSGTTLVSYGKPSKPMLYSILSEISRLDVRRQHGSLFRLDILTKRKTLKARGATPKIWYIDEGDV